MGYIGCRSMCTVEEAVYRWPVKNCNSRQLPPTNNGWWPFGEMNTQSIPKVHSYSQNLQRRRGEEQIDRQEQPCTTRLTKHFSSSARPGQLVVNQTINLLFSLLLSTAILPPARRSPETARLSYRLSSLVVNNPLFYSPSIPPRCSTSPQMIFQYVSIFFSTPTSLTGVF